MTILAIFLLCVWRPNLLPESSQHPPSGSPPSQHFMFSYWFQWLLVTVELAMSCSVDFTGEMLQNILPTMPIACSPSVKIEMNWYILGSNFLGREFSWRVCILNLCPCVVDSCQLGWSVCTQRMSKENFNSGKQPPPWTAFFSCPCLTDCLQNVWYVLSCLIRVVQPEFTIALVSQGHHPHPHCPCLAHGSWFGVCFRACLSPLDHPPQPSPSSGLAHPPVPPGCLY